MLSFVAAFEPVDDAYVADLVVAKVVAVVVDGVAEPLVAAAAVVAVAAVVVVVAEAVADVGLAGVCAGAVDQQLVVGQGWCMSQLPALPWYHRCNTTTLYTNK